MLLIQLNFLPREIKYNTKHFFLLLPRKKTIVLGAQKIRFVFSNFQIDLLMATSNSDNQSDLLFNCNSCKILLKQGNLLDEKDVNCIVIPTPPSSEGDADSFAVFKEFNKRANDHLKKEAEKIRRQLQPEQALKVMENNRGYMFVLLPYLKNEKKAHDLIKKNYTSCLKLAVQNNARSVAFPTIGCGGRRFDSGKVAGLTFAAFEEFLGGKEGKKLDEIRIVVYSSEVMRVFTNTFMNLALEEKSKIKFKESYVLVLVNSVFH